MKTKTFITSIIILITLLINISCENNQKDYQSDSVNVENIETDFEGMQSKYPSDNSAWDILDENIKSKIQLDYKNTKDKREFFENYYDGLGVPVLIDFLEYRYPYCHIQGHDLGRTVFSKVLDLNKALTLCGNGCTYGCMHGVIAEAFGDEKYKKIIKSVNSLCGEISGNLIADNLEDVTKGMSEFCASGEMSNQYRKGNCAHAMGHALLGLSQYNLEKSIETCKSFDNKGMGYYCATGAFMEYVENLVRNKEYKKLEKDQTEHFPCDVYDDYPAACYRYMLSIIAHRKGVKLMDMVSECKKLDKRMRRGCFHALGLKFMRRIVKDPNLMKTVCLAGNEDDAIMCIEGVIERLVEIDEDQAFKLCSYLEGENKQICETSAYERKYSIDKSTIGLYCK